MSLRNRLDFSSKSTWRARSGHGPRGLSRRCSLEWLEDRTVFSFSAPAVYPVSPSPQGITTGDFNGDGRPDLALAISAGAVGSVNTLLTNANGTFQAAQSTAAGTSYPVYSVAAGDLDQDGTTDFVTASRGGPYDEHGNLGMVFGNGDGTFAAPVNLSFYGPLSAAVGDLDADGDLDVVISIKVVSYIDKWGNFEIHHYDYYTATFMNQLDTVNHFANLTFATATYIGTASPGPLTIGDINGRASVAFVQGGQARVMLGNGAGFLAAPVTVAAGTSPTAVAIGDVTFDGRPDLVVANGGSNDVSVLAGTGSTSPMFQSPVSYPVGTNPVSVALADVNADGKLDIVTANAGSNNVSALLRTNGGTFQSAVNYALGFSPSALTIANFNGDTAPGGRPYNDLAVVNSTGNSVAVLLNGADWTPISTVVGRNLFYNQSKFDGNDAAIGASDDGAIATDKTAYLPDGSLATFVNVSSYSRGINGVMVDLAGGGNHAVIRSEDFIFKVGNNNAPSTWDTLTVVPTISVRLGAGVGGSDRVEITWPAGSIRDSWLEVQVLSTARTGLTAADVHFWGNKVGDIGTSTPDTTFLTSSIDKTALLGSIANGVTVTNTRDFNRDGNVTAIDATIVLGSLGSIQRLQLGAAGPFAPAGPASASATGIGDNGIASALAETARAPAIETVATLPAPPVASDLRYRVWAEAADHVLAQIGERPPGLGQTPQTDMGLGTSDELDEEVLDSLVAALLSK
jgi:hypothetical protein